MRWRVPVEMPVKKFEAAMSCYLIVPFLPVRGSFRFANRCWQNEAKTAQLHSAGDGQRQPSGENMPLSLNYNKPKPRVGGPLRKEIRRRWPRRGLSRQ